MFLSIEDEEVNEAGNENEDNVFYSIDEEILFNNPKISSVVLIKDSPFLEADKSLESQLLFIKLKDSNPCKTFHSYISSVLAPHFKSHVKKTRRAER